ncbi:glycosyltransferase family 4 protein [Pseudogemmobacter humi]|uniref:GDP-mannose-dependent alpha-(1-6)-phosphatidylinositol monomannoside mannosyltransferase n=1 Tax=Pseudogemmobacter humi TaxID=2483812 RepID=A0A3P5XGN8_9RHOB|nr:glycosyltransferase family 4 protein [Pseudogemmobacter humi]VDC33966.1 GDP-mannose-dependent alpha-(1-6)-phosphatidylinositol monomannoside mannosyltransferase [Pseudogemmobacter humi]
MSRADVQAGRIVFAALESYSMVGGLQQFNRRVVSALSSLAENAHAPHPVVVLKGDKPTDVADRPERVRFHACGASRIQFARQLLTAVTSADILLLGHVNLLPFALLARLRRPRLRVVLFVHGHDVWGTPGTRPVRWWEPLLARSLNRVASVSAFTAGRMAKSFRLPASTFSVFPNAVDALTAAPAKDSSGAPHLLTVSRLAAHDGGKHHDTVLQAMPRILQEIPEAKYQVIGDGVLRPGLEQMARDLGVADSVIFSGRVSDEDLARAYAEAEIFVMPSEKEGFGIVFLEAWQRGLPVICGTADAAHEVVSDGVDGFAIPHDDPGQLADKVISLLKDPALARRMGEAGHDKVASQYMMPRFTANLDQLLKDVMA